MLKIFITLDDFQPWCGAIPTWERIKKEDKVDDLEMLLEEIYPDSLEDVALNDILWFEEEWLFENLGIKGAEE